MPALVHGPRLALAIVRNSLALIAVELQGNGSWLRSRCLVDGQVVDRAFLDQAQGAEHAVAPEALGVCNQDSSLAHQYVSLIGPSPAKKLVHTSAP